MEKYGIDLDDYSARAIGSLCRAGKEYWLLGHFGAALLSGIRLLENDNLPPPAARALAERLRKTVAADPARYEPAESNAAVDPSVACMPITERIESHIGGLHESGHGTIFAVSALRVFFERPEFATPSNVDSICGLIESAVDAARDRYFGLDAKSEIAAAAKKASSSAQTPWPDLIVAVAKEFDCLYPDAEIDGHRYFFTGEKYHSLTHLHALIQLDKLGYTSLAQNGVPLIRAQIRLTRQQPPGDPVPRKLEPGSAEVADYWKITGDPWHDIKFAEAVVDLLPLVPADRRSGVAHLLAKAFGALSVGH